MSNMETIQVTGIERADIRYTVRSVLNKVITDIDTLSQGHMQHKRRALEIEQEHTEILEIINKNNAAIDNLNKASLTIQLAYAFAVTTGNVKNLLDAISLISPDEATSLAEQLKVTWNVPIPTGSDETPAES